MPHVNIWIRRDDFDAWESIKDKPEFLHDALNGVQPEKYNKAVEERKEVRKVLKPVLERMKAQKDDVEFCKHDAVKGFCKKGCK
jgi:hypothetical protein